MKTLFFLLAFSTFTFAQKSKATDVVSDQKQCTVKMSIKQLTAQNLDFKCAESSNNEILKVENFKIKFIGNPSVEVKGSSLNDVAKELASISKVGDRAYIFDFGDSNPYKEDSQMYKSIFITIID